MISTYTHTRAHAQMDKGQPCGIGGEPPPPLVVRPEAKAPRCHLKELSACARQALEASQGTHRDIAFATINLV